MSKAGEAYEEALRRIASCTGDELTLSELELTALPPEIGQLAQLQRLYVSDNQLTALPPEIGQLERLQLLDVRGNQMTALPPEIGQLERLQLLDVRGNELTALPPEIGQLARLQQLSVSGNELTALPPDVGQLERLQQLDVNGNQLTALPPEIGQLERLQLLEVRHNQMTALPPEIGQLAQLQQLDVGDNQLTALPPEIGQLAQLQQLYASGNDLTALPPEIGQLAQLQQLYVSYNELTTLPPEIGQLAQLQQLAVSHNQMTALPPEIGQLAQLQQLAVSHNQLTTLLPEIGQLASLTHLDLFRTNLATLPSEVGQLASLSRLDLSESPLESLPATLRQLERLERLNVVGCAALGLPREITGTETNDWGVDPKPILDYYFSRQEHGERPLNEVKLLLVGRGEAGKTCVSRALRGLPFEKEQGETPGIEIHPWQLACPDNDDVKVWLWDFAGQEIVHETHRFFLTERSLYLVVLDGRTGQQMQEAEYWLGHVDRYGSHREGNEVKRSPVIVVLNKWESPGPYEVERRRLLREHPNVVAFVETDCESNLGISELTATIRDVLEQMPSVRRTWPTSYFNVRQRLSEMTDEDQHFLTWADFREVCSQEGEKDEGRQQSMAENLNALGVALYYGQNERLRDTRVLNPNWAANGLYGLIRGVNKRPHKKKQGTLWAGDVVDVLTAGLQGMESERHASIDDYPEEKNGVRVHDFLLELMLDRELGFRAGTHEGQPVYLLPGLLPIDEPPADEFDVAEHVAESELRFRYRYELLPAGLMSRFIVRTHPLSDGLPRWKRGVVLGWNKSRALVLSERHRNPRIDVLIRGGDDESRLELAGIVRTNFDAIHAGLPGGLRGDEELDLSLPGDQFESVTKLKKLEEDGHRVQIMTAEGAKDLDVTPELDRVQPAAARKGGARRVRVFVSYSHEDYKLWNALKMHLDILINAGLVEYWYDGKLRVGVNWDEVIRDELNRSDIVILMLSNGFYHSQYIQGVECERARERLKLGEAEIMPVLYEETPAFDDVPWIKDLQVVPTENGALKAVKRHSPHRRGWNAVQLALRELIADFRAKKDGGRPS